MLNVIGVFILCCPFLYTPRLFPITPPCMLPIPVALYICPVSIVYVIHVSYTFLPGEMLFRLTVHCIFYGYNDNKDLLDVTWVHRTPLSSQGHYISLSFFDVLLPGDVLPIKHIRPVHIVAKSCQRYCPCQFWAMHTVIVIPFLTFDFWCGWIYNVLLFCIWPLVLHLTIATFLVLFLDLLIKTSCTGILNKLLSPVSYTHIFPTEGQLKDP